LPPNPCPPLLPGRSLFRYCFVLGLCLSWPTSFPDMLSSLPDGHPSVRQEHLAGSRISHYCLLFGSRYCSRFRFIGVHFVFQLGHHLVVFGSSFF
jgi:hypothetical protein